MPGEKMHVHPRSLYNCHLKLCFFILTVGGVAAIAWFNLCVLKLGDSYKQFKSSKSESILSAFDILYIQISCQIIKKSYMLYIHIVINFLFTAVSDDVTNIVTFFDRMCQKPPNFSNQPIRLSRPNPSAMIVGAVKTEQAYALRYGFFPVNTVKTSIVFVVMRLEYRHAPDFNNLK
jgi:hypothetical protein